MSKGAKVKKTSPNDSGKKRQNAAHQMDMNHFAFGSMESRAAARLLLEERNAEADRQRDYDRIWALCAKPRISWKCGPMLWLTNYTQTEDTHWFDKGTPPFAPFPKKSYFLPVADSLLGKETLFICKSREMMTSWLACGLIAWMTQWFPKIQWVMQTEKETKVIELVNYCRILFSRQEGWMKKRSPIIADSKNRIKLSNGSEIIGVPSGANQVRLYHPHGVLFDEAAFLPEFGQSFCTVLPVAKQVWAISSAGGPGLFEEMCTAPLSGSSEIGDGLPQFNI
jgi:hypothetical protein